ncbi:MAG: hypothetical protein QF692_01805 [Alphaproteobacteria bacterium]|jgi:hypothetical protein|nr:hypothetical protein [Alphaproteobacteria bacterium]
MVDFIFYTFLLLFIGVVVFYIYRWTVALKAFIRVQLLPKNERHLIKEERKLKKAEESIKRMEDIKAMREKLEAKKKEIGVKDPQAQSASSYIVVIVMFCVLYFAIWKGDKILDEVPKTSTAKPDIVQCIEGAKQYAQNPSTYKMHWLMDAAWMDHDNGRKSLHTSFTAANAFGVESTHRVRCLYGADGNLMEVNIID